MIATILPSSANFHAVAYNEKKVAKGVARLLEMSNLGHIGVLSKPTAKEMQDYMIAYSSRNSRIKKAQFHLAISCKGHEKTEEELLQFAHEYLKEMGYGNEGQPLLVYAHTDTDNTHIHIVTSRISPDGKKISDHHEECVLRQYSTNLSARMSRRKPQRILLLHSAIHSLPLLNTKLL